ncbi:neutral alpha-glucosidase AB-like isoform X3 [Varroa destructor]|uniref:Glucosidase II subunit alpha n=1 Tax=Varroa destructor TaxID=109461 RepID=A0A7M7JUS2_VARDE|nr:neutral alpha-glucosidase AB-like isoform X3 [Varroa destructor]
MGCKDSKPARGIQFMRMRDLLHSGTAITVCVTVLVALLLEVTYAVDRSNFKTCEQSGFCRRNRRLQPGQSPFIALTTTAEQKDASHVELDILNSHNQQAFMLRLEGIEGGTLRMTIDEKNCPVRRYIALPALRSGIKNIPITLISKTEDKLEATFGADGRVVVSAEPLRIDVYSRDTLVFSGNARGLMVFEHYRHREHEKKNAKAEEEKKDADDEVDPSKVSYNERGEKIVDGKKASLSGGFFSKFWDGEAKKDIDANADTEKDNSENAHEGANKTGEDLDGAWEENFKGHIDSKPRGPMSVGMDFTFEDFTFVYGLPEHADSFALRPTNKRDSGSAISSKTATNQSVPIEKTDPYRMYNLDVFEYETNNPMALYGTVPVMIGHNEERTVGLLWLNPSETWIDIESPAGGVLSSVVDFVSNKKHETRRETHWFSETGVIDVFFMLGPKPKDIAKQYALLTGTTPLPPMFSLAYHQSRWNYNDQDDVSAVDAGFDEHDIPMDVIWLDIEHTDGKRYFTWDSIKFSKPEEMIRNLTAKGRHMVTIIDPHIKRDPNYHVHSEASAKGYYVKDKAGNDYDGWCWPGSSSYLDFFNPEVRDYWAKKFALDQYKGSTEQLFTWNDMNEPSVFNGPEVTMQKDCKHVSDVEHRDVHNLYGLMFTSSTYEGHLYRSKGKLRPFVLSRSFFAGSQRYGAVWTGDNMAAWDHLRVTIPMLLSLSISGITFVGADVGGFFGSPDSEMMIRWNQMAAYQPFFRGHAHHDSRRREPWLFDEITVNILRDQLRMRYSMLPLWYTLFYENEIDGQPPMRPLWWEFPMDKETFGMDDAHLVGDRLLVKPVLTQGATSIDIYFPGRDTVWYDYLTHQKFAGGTKVTQAVTQASIPVFRRGGSIIFTKERVRRSSPLQAKDPYTITIALDKSGTSANGTLYIDDEATFDYRSGALIYSLAQYRDGVLNYQLLKGPGNFTTPAWVERIVLVGVPKLPTKITYGDQLLEFAHAEQTVTVRKPGFHVDSAWSIKFYY